MEPEDKNQSTLFRTYKCYLPTTLRKKKSANLAGLAIETDFMKSTSIKVSEIIDDFLSEKARKKSF